MRRWLQFSLRSFLVVASATAILPVWCLHTAFGDPADQSANAVRRNVGRRNESHSVSDRKWPLAVHQLSDDERNALRVEWGRPTVSPLGGKHRHLAVPGRLFLVAPDGKKLPVDWLQGIRVVVAKSPDEQQDWSHGHALEESAGGDVMVNWDNDKDQVRAGGKFEAQIPIAEIERPIGRPGKFQVGVSLAEQSEQRITWSNTMPVLAATISRIEVSGQPVPSDAVQAINGAPSAGWDYDPAAMIRAVNMLQGLGKERAIKALRDYLKLASIDGPGFEKRLAASIDTSDQSCLELLIPLSFERIDPTEKLPERDWENGGYQLEHDRWPYFDVRLEGDIPFHVVLLAHVGSRSTTAWLVDWAEEHARLRPGPLKPVSDPLEAAERMCQKEGNRSGMDDNRRRYIRMQAVRMVAPLLDDAAAENDVLDIAQWENLKSIVGQMHLQWEAGRQGYVSQSARRK